MSKAKSINQLKDEYQAILAERVSKNAAIADQEAYIDKLTAEVEKAAKSGDIKLYKAKLEEKTDAMTALYVMQRSCDIENRIDSDEAKTAWTEYGKEHDSRMKKMLADYTAAVDALREQYEALVTYQNEALVARETLADMTSIPASDYNLEVWLPNTWEEAYAGARGLVPEVEFFVKSGYWTGKRIVSGNASWAEFPAMNTVNGVVMMHMATKPEF